MSAVAGVVDWLTAGSVEVANQVACSIGGALPSAMFKNAPQSFCRLVLFLGAAIDAGAGWAEGAAAGVSVAETGVQALAQAADGLELP